MMLESESDRLTLDFRLVGSLPVDKRRVAFLAKAARKMMPHVETRSPPCYLTYAVNHAQHDTCDSIEPSYETRHSQANYSRRIFIKFIRSI